MSAAAGLLCWLAVVELLFGTEGRRWNLGPAPGLESGLEPGLGFAPGVGLGLGSEQVKVANNTKSDSTIIDLQKTSCNETFVCYHLFTCNFAVDFSKFVPTITARTRSLIDFQSLQESQLLTEYGLKLSSNRF